MERDDLKAILKGNDPSKKREMLLFFWEHEIKFPIAYLHSALQDKDKKVRSTAAFVLSKLGNRNSVKHLVAAWDQCGAKDTTLKRQILIALQDIAGINGINKVIRDFSHWHVSLQELVADYVQAAGNERGRAFFVDEVSHHRLNRKTLSILKERKILYDGK